VPGDPQRVQAEVHRALGNAGQRERDLHPERRVHQLRIGAHVHGEALQRREIVLPRHRAHVLAKVFHRHLIRRVLRIGEQQIREEEAL
jgi:hypothetical protein